MVGVGVDIDLETVDGVVPLDQPDAVDSEQIERVPSCTRLEIGYLVLPPTVVEDKDIETVASGQRVVAAAAFQRIIAATAIQIVVELVPKILSVPLPPSAFSMETVG